MHVSTKLLENFQCEKAHRLQMHWNETFARMCSATDPNQNCTYELSLLVLRKVSILSYTRQRERQRKSNCKIDSTFKLVSFSWNCVCACVQVSMSVCAEHFSYLVHFICRCSFAYVLRTSLSFLENATIPYLSVFRFMHGA